jgi:hypothetical protein
MDNTQVLEKLDEILVRLCHAGWKEREEIKAELHEAAVQAGAHPSIVGHLEDARKSMPLEARWEVDEVLEMLTPPETAEEEEVEEEEEEPEDPNKQLTMSDLDVVYDDPRGLVVYKSKKGERWFAAQPDPMTGQPRMFELGAPEVEQLKAQLAGSPYWVLGSGGAA